MQLRPHSYQDDKTARTYGRYAYHPRRQRFPSQIETVLIENGYPANYQIIVDRQTNTDSIEVRVEISESTFTDTIRGMAAAERKMEAAFKSLLGIAAKVRLMEPGSIERSEGKAKRVIDRRNLLD